MSRRDELVLVHADGGACHGMAIGPDGRCPGCGIRPDMQSTELWPPGEVRGKHGLPSDAGAVALVLIVCLAGLVVLVLEHM